jgi:hypothetical protein
MLHGLNASVQSWKYGVSSAGCSRYLCLCGGLLCLLSSFARLFMLLLLQVRQVFCLNFVVLCFYGCLKALKVAV